MSPLIPVHCRDCRRPGKAPHAVVRVVDGPGVVTQDATEDTPGAVCWPCPQCGRPTCVLVLRHAA